jgi:signal transduction histidine kinase
VNHAGDIAHEFNNLLGVIMNYADFVLRALDAPPPEEVKDILERARADTEMIFRAAEAAAALARQLCTGDGASTGLGGDGAGGAGTGPRIMVVDDDDAMREGRPADPRRTRLMERRHDAHVRR